MFQKHSHHTSSAAAQQHRISSNHLKRVRDDVLFSLPMNTAAAKSNRHQQATVVEAHEIDCAPRESRASRHIPQRDDMVVSSYNLTSGIGNNSLSGDSFGCASSQHHADDSSIVAECYRETLAESLGHGVSKKLGGDVLSFTLPNPRTPSDPFLTSQSLSLKMLRRTEAPIQRPMQRIIHSNPDRVLDAPQIPSFPSTQLLDWGANNKIVIGMRSTLYTWDEEKRQAIKVLDVDSSHMIRCTQWLNRCSGVALTITTGETAIFDVESAGYVRRIDAPEGPVSQLASEGPMLAIGSNETGSIRICDLRSRQNVVAPYEGHHGRISSLRYNFSEPLLLASGGSDGCIRVWDARRPDASRHMFHNAHKGAVSALAWHPDRRSAFFSGGDDSVLRLIDYQNINPVHRSVHESQPGHLPGVVRSVHTGNPITGVACPPKTDEVATSHAVFGHIQLRHAPTFRTVGTFQTLSSKVSISCFVVSPDHEQVCAAQQDETLKFWRVFSKKAPETASSGRGLFDGFDDMLR